MSPSQTASSTPARGDVWDADLEPVRGHEIGRRRPVVVISSNAFNQGPAGLVVVAPMTTVNKHIPLHVVVEPPEGGIRVISYIKPEDIRSIAKTRLSVRWGTVSPKTMAEIGERLQLLLEF